MMLSEPTLATIQADHQHWLRDIEHWNGDLVLLQNEQALFVKEIARRQQVIQQHGSTLQAHAATLKSLKDEIVASEREMAGLQGREPGQRFAEAHAKTEANLTAQRDLHERLKREHQSLMTQLAMS